MTGKFRIVELGDAIVDVSFFRGISNGRQGWWIVREGRNIEHSGFAFRLGESVPTADCAADAVHLSFCNEAKEGLSCPKATGENVALIGRSGQDAIAYTVIARRKRVEWAADHEAPVAVQ